MSNFIVYNCPLCDKEYKLKKYKKYGKIIIEDLSCFSNVGNVTHYLIMGFNELNILAIESLFLTLEIPDFRLEFNFLPVFSKKDIKSCDLLVRNYVNIIYTDRVFDADNINFNTIKNSPESFLKILKYYFNTTDSNLDDLNSILSDPENLKNIGKFL